MKGSVGAEESYLVSNQPYQRIQEGSQTRFYRLPVGIQQFLEPKNCIWKDIINLHR